MIIRQCSIVDFNFDTFRNTEVESKQCMRDHPPIAYRDEIGTAFLLFNFTLILDIKSRRPVDTSLDADASIEIRSSSTKISKTFILTGRR
jgi:hypothetical protein